MGLMKISSGVCPPNDINAVIEIPAHGDPVKYEVDKETGVLMVDRFIGTPMRYPCNYGYIPNTLADDGDPADILAITPFPVLSGAVLRCRPIGLLSMVDEAGKDNKILAVPVDSVSSLYHAVNTPSDLPSPILDSIVHFFEHYKDFEPGKWVKLAGWLGVDAAQTEIQESIARYARETG